MDADAALKRVSASVAPRSEFRILNVQFTKLTFCNSIPPPVYETATFLKITFRNLVPSRRILSCVPLASKMTYSDRFRQTTPACDAPAPQYKQLQRPAGLCPLHLVLAKSCLASPSGSPIQSQKMALARAEDWSKMWSNGIQHAA
jgi:hypothetical protein